MKNGTQKIVIKSSNREIIRKRVTDALLAEMYKQNGTESYNVVAAVEGAVNTLLGEFRLVRR